MSRPKGSKNRATLLQMQEQATNIPLGLDIPETDDEIKARLTKTFRVYDKITKGIINKKIRSSIVVGASGCGKTYSAEKALMEAADNKII